MSMKTRKILTMAALLMLTVGLFSCKDEPKKAAENTTQQEGITFTFTMPGGDAHVVDTRALHDNPEWAIDQLWMYVLDEKGEKVIEEPVNIRNTQEFKFSGTVAKYTYKEKWEKDKLLQFFFVANMNIGIAKDATKADLLAKVHEYELKTKSEDILYKNDPTLYANGQNITVEKDDGKRIPMTAYATQGNSRVIAISGNATVEVKLKRTIARIDIVNRIPDFKITKLELFNAFKKANVVEESTNVLNANRLTTSVAPYATLDANNTIGKRQGTEIKKAFYLYEGKNVGVPDNEVTYVKITADYGGKSGRVFVIPFKAKDAQGKFTVAKDVKRNYLYKIDLGTKIDEVTGALVDFTIDEEPWNADDFEEPLSLIYITGAIFAKKYYNSATIEVANNAEHTYTLELDNDIKDNGTYSIATSDNWLTVPATVTATQANEAMFTFKVAANTTDKERVGTITIKTAKLTKPADVFTLTVKQPK